MNTWKLYGIQNEISLCLEYIVVTKFDIYEMGYQRVLNMAPKLKSAMNSMPENDRL